MAYEAPDNIYWMFSSAAQAIAAFIGFLVAGFFFVYEKLDKGIEKDGTLEDVFNDLKLQYFNRLRVLLILTGLSIILSLGAVFLNGIELYPFWAILIRVSVSGLNVFTVAWAIYFIIFIINPKKVEITTQKLINKSKDVFNPTEGNTLSRGEYLEKFIELEKVIRLLGNQFDIQFMYTDIGKAYTSTRDIIQELFQRETITSQQYHDLLEVNKVRNLTAHGQIESIKKGIGDKVDRLLKELKELKK